MENPRQYVITYLPVLDPKEKTGSLDALIPRYLSLYDGKEELCREEMIFAGFKLFKVIY